MVVVDASALTALAFGEPEAEALAARLDGEALHAPSHLRLELASATWSRCRRHPRDQERAMGGFLKVLSLPVEIHGIDPIAVLAVAMESGLTVYDAAYLWLARRLGAPLVTLDRQLAAAARES